MIREPIEESGMTLLEDQGETIVLLEDSGVQSTWAHDENGTGYCVEFQGKTYRYVNYVDG